MITVISGTNRKNSKTEIVAKYYYETIKSITGTPVKYFSLQDIPLDTLNPEMYEENGQSSELRKLQDEYLVDAHKWVIISPEYNGSYPGVLKLFLDAVSIRKYKETFKNKKLGLVGVASGRGGNLRGLDQLTNSMNYLGFSVMANKLPLSLIDKSISNEQVSNDATESAILNHAEQFIKF